MKLETFFQLVGLLVVIFIGFKELLPKEKLDIISIIVLISLITLIIMYSISSYIMEKINKIDKNEKEILKLKDQLNFRKISEDLNIRITKIEDKLKK